MKQYTSCKAAIDACLANKTFALAHLYNDEKPMEVHIHSNYEMYYSISGGKQFLIDNYFYTIKPGDIFFINQYESHHLTQIDKEIHERIVYSIDPSFLQSLSTPDTDLDFCFRNRSIHYPHQFHLDKEAQNRFLYLTHKVSSPEGFGSDLLEQAAFLELMVFLTGLVRNHVLNHDSQAPAVYSNQVNDILSYINQNITGDISLPELADHFYLSSSYLCRIFKAATGITVHKYITAKRITMAKVLLSEGCSVNETCERCGFRDYSSFFKSFTSAVGISPKKFAQCQS